MPNYNKLSLIVAVLALVVTIVSTVLAYFAIDASWKIAEATGSLDKADFVIGLQGYPLPTSGRTKVIIGAPELSTKTVTVVGALPFSIVSNGKKSVEGLSITFQYHKFFQRSVLEGMSMKAAGEYISQEVKHSFTETGDLSFASYRIPLLNPGVGVKIAEPLFLSDQHLKIDAPVTTKDGVKLTIPVEITLSQSFAVNVSGKDISIHNYVIDVSIEKASSMDELLHSSIPIAVDTEQERVRNELGFLGYLGALIFSSPKGSIYLVYVPLDDVSVGDIRVYGPKESQRAGVAEFDLLSWKLLFSTK